jgi:hypothetical protein
MLKLDTHTAPGPVAIAAAIGTEARMRTDRGLRCVSFAVAWFEAC